MPARGAPHLPREAADLTQRKHVASALLGEFPQRQRVHETPPSELRKPHEPPAIFAGAALRLKLGAAQETACAD
jgi:hypothetical protein